MLLIKKIYKKKNYYFLYVFLIFFLHIKADEEAEAPQPIIGTFECKIKKDVDSKKILPLTVELKNIGKSAVVIPEKIRNSTYCQALADYSSREKVYISTGDLIGVKKAIINSGSSFSIDLDLYAELLKLTKFNENLNAELTLRFVVMSDRVNYEVISKPFKLTDFFEEKLIKEVYLTKNEAKLELEANNKGEIFCKFTNNSAVKKAFIFPNLENTQIRMSFSLKSGAENTHYFNRLKFNYEEISKKKPEEVTLLQKKLFKI